MIGRTHEAGRSNQPKGWIARFDQVLFVEELKLANAHGLGRKIRAEQRGEEAEDRHLPPYDSFHFALMYSHL